MKFKFKIPIPFAIVVGHAFESYDYFVYAFLTTVIAELFFPNADPFISLIYAIAVFSIAYFSRMIGGLVFGYLGDKHGRKKMFILSMLLLVFSTISMGLLPVYAQIGIWASILMLIMRLLQGFAFGGEFTGTAVYLMEFAPKVREGAIGSLFFVALGAGYLLASLCTAIFFFLLSPEEFLRWGWRMPLLFGGVTGILALWCRIYLKETTDFIEMKGLGEISKNPIMEVLKEGKLQTAALMGISLTHSLAGILFFVFVPIFLVKVAGLSSANASLISVTSISVFIIFALFWGWLSDITGRRLMLALSSIALMIFSPLIFYFCSFGDFKVCMLAVIFYGIIYAAYASPTVPLVKYLIPRNIRATSYAIALNIVNSFISGPSPLIAALLIHATGSKVSPGFMISIGAAISFITILLYKEIQEPNQKNPKFKFVINS